ncbi:hypothetical protein QRX60_31895 [Amycolatopsis mongoliensis]|uniref:Uncharacterized protein n=1 Tax=Amycolatopsis mongoliensis TaxID=715475 RepID=A0A9Y2NGG4_9PSEU|nr:hypothetical protein [Amycolatopsis sp. 4-36]WIX98652.1 hypothetical protein QRX60_31895 [Amycolatopsis sp. 4-36]
MLEHYRAIAIAADRHPQAVPELPLPEEFPGRAEALDWFDAERANLTAAVALGMTTYHLETSGALSGTLVRYFERRHHLLDWEIVARYRVVTAKQLGIPGAIGAASNSLGAAVPGTVTVCGRSGRSSRLRLRRGWDTKASGR